MTTPLNLPAAQPPARPRTSSLRRALALSGLCLTALSAQAGVCDGLADARVSADQIGLPTSGALVRAARAVGPLGRAPDHCEVSGEIAPVDPTAPPIRFQLNLPARWNGKALHFGGGGFDGSVVSGTGNVSHAWPGSSTPLERGYATYGSDSGHTGSDPDASFGRNDEALRNFTGEALKKVHDVAQALMLKRYARLPSLTYFAGGSTGGREALSVAQRYPRDYQGIIAHYPALEFLGMMMRANAFAQALYGPGGFTSWGKLENLNRHVIDECDAIDGLADGLINNVGACHFDPQVLRCWSNIDWGDSCLTDAQLATVRTLSEPHPLAFELANGVDSAAPYGILYGANFSGPVDIGTWPELLDPPVLGLNGYVASMHSEYLNHIITRDPAFSPFNFDPVTAGPWQARVQAVSALHDATSVDLSEFVQRGGKILLAHGTSDTIVPFSVSVRYVARLRQAMGSKAVDQFLRFYQVPGFGHGEGRYTLAWKSLDLLEDWVERGVAPKRPVMRNVLHVLGQERPMCRYPAFARYRGGDVQQASSYVCARR